MHIDAEQCASFWCSSRVGRIRRLWVAVLCPERACVQAAADRARALLATKREKEAEATAGAARAAAAEEARTRLLEQVQRKPYLRACRKRSDHISVAVTTSVLQHSATTIRNEELCMSLIFFIDSPPPWFGQAFVGRPGHSYVLQPKTRSRGRAPEGRTGQEPKIVHVGPAHRVYK